MPRRAPRRGHLHRLRHRGGAPRPARAAAGRAPARPRVVAHRRRALRRPARRPRGAAPDAARDDVPVAVDRLGRASVDAREAGRRPGRRRGRRAGGQPRGRHAAAGRRGRGGADGVPLFVDACASAGPAAAARRAGPRPRPRRTSGAAPPASGVLLVRKGARWRSPFPERRPRRRARQRLRERARRPWPRRPRCRRSWPSGTRSTRASARWSTGSARRSRAIPDVEVVGDPVDRLPHLVTFSCLYVDGEALVTELDRRGFGVASGSACTASTLEPSHVLAAMGALTHGNVRVSLTPRHRPRPTSTRFLAALPEVVARASAPRPGCDRWTPTSSSTAAGCSARCRSSSWPAPRRRPGRRHDRGGRRPTSAARVDVPAWCRMRGQEYVGEDAAADGTPALRGAPAVS